MKNIFEHITRKQVLTWLGMVLVGLILGWMIFGGKGNHQETVQMDEHVHTEGEIQLWTCSMHPQIQQDHAGNCPICGMELIPLTDGTSGGQTMPGELQMTEVSMKIAEIQTTQVRTGAPMKELYLTGKVKPDETRISELTARFPGRIEKLYVNFTGQQVRQGQKLASIYSPELITAQKELFEATKLKELSPQMYQAARNKLRLWNLNDAQIDEIETQGAPKFNFDILSPLTGTVMMRHVVLGDYIKEGSPLFEIVDLRRLWVMFDGYESDLAWVKLRDKIEFSVKSIPGKTFNSTVTFIDPVINPMTRVASIRTELNNAGGQLKPDMFVRGRITSRLPGKKDALMVPKSSVLWTGKRAIVYVKVPNRDEPSFMYKEIELGEEAGEYYVVANGLTEGDEVVTHGAFKIDAASQLLGKPSMMNPEGGKVSTGHNHGDTGGNKATTQPSEDHSQHQASVAESVDPAFKKQLGDVVKAYLALKDALVASDNSSAKKEASQVLKALEKTDMSLLKGAAHNSWMDHLSKLKSSSEAISKTGDINAQRTAFATLGDALYDSVKHFGVSGPRLYHQYCPMAFNNKGAFWLSTQEEIHNPYFGDAMLTCGENKETLK